MVKEARFFSAVRTKVVLDCVSVICLASLVSSADDHSSTNSFSPASNDSFIREVKRGVKLETNPEVLAQCGKNVTLTCDAIPVNGEFTRMTLSWLEFKTKKQLCTLRDGVITGEALCSTASSDPPENHQLVLTLINMKPANQGQYVCKLYSNLGTSNNSTHVKLQDCPGRSEFIFSEDKSRVECSFHGVHPTGTVHWFKSDVNLTDSTTTEAQEDPEGLFTVRSTFTLPNTQREGTSQSYSCSLWQPGTQNYQTMMIPQSQGQLGKESSGNTVKLQWIPFVVGLLTVKFMT